MYRTGLDLAGSRVWVIGAMASGKSTVGRALAERMGCRLVDNDETIAELAGESTLALSEQGEEVLHDWESRYVTHVIGLPAPVVAGIAASTADRLDDLRNLTEAGLLVVLDVPVAVLTERVLADPPRPWMDGDVRGQLEAMVSRRAPALQEHAGLLLDGTQPVADLVDQILARLSS